MTTEKKAKQLALTLVGDDQNPGPLIDVLIEMANWQMQQMMKDAVDGLVVCDELTHGYKDIAMPIPDNLEAGDKVKIIILKRQ